MYVKIIDGSTVDLSTEEIQNRLDMYMYVIAIRYL